MKKKTFKERVEDYLFETNLRWAEIHTRILNRIPITPEMKKEYEEIITKTLKLFYKNPDLLKWEVIK